MGRSMVHQGQVGGSGFWRRLVVAVWVVGFFVGGSSHLIDVVQWGWLPYTHVPILLNAYFTALLPLDFLVAALVLFHRRVGLLVGVAVLVSDLAANAWVIVQPDIGGWHWRYTLILAFSLFAALTMSQLWRIDQSAEAENATDHDSPS